MGTMATDSTVTDVGGTGTVAGMTVVEETTLDATTEPITTQLTTTQPTTAESTTTESTTVEATTSQSTATQLITTESTTTHLTTTQLAINHTSQDVTTSTGSTATPEHTERITSIRDQTTEARYTSVSGGEGSTDSGGRSTGGGTGTTDGGGSDGGGNTLGIALGVTFGVVAAVVLVLVIVCLVKRNRKNKRKYRSDIEESMAWKENSKATVARSKTGTLFYNAPFTSQETDEPDNPDHTHSEGGNYMELRQQQAESGQYEHLRPKALGHLLQDPSLRMSGVGPISMNEDGSSGFGLYKDVKSFRSCETPPKAVDTVPKIVDSTENEEGNVQNNGTTNQKSPEEEGAVSKTDSVLGENTANEKDNMEPAAFSNNSYDVNNDSETPDLGTNAYSEIKTEGGQVENEYLEVH